MLQTPCRVAFSVNSTPRVFMNTETYLMVCPFLFDVVLRVQRRIKQQSRTRAAALNLSSARTGAHLRFHPGNQRRDLFPFNNSTSQPSGLCHKTALRVDEVTLKRL